MIIKVQRVISLEELFYYLLDRENSEKREKLFSLAEMRSIPGLHMVNSRT